MPRKRPPPLLESDLPESARNLVRLIGWERLNLLEKLHGDTHVADAR